MRLRVAVWLLRLPLHLLLSVLLDNVA